MDLRTATSQMILAFEESKEFKELRAIMQELNKNPQNRKSLDNLRQLQKRLYGNNLSEQEATKIMNELNTQYNSLQAIPEFVKYFDASNKFDHMFSMVTNDIAKNVEIRLTQ